jgi:hypothetical protein
MEIQKLINKICFRHKSSGFFIEKSIKINPFAYATTFILRIKYLKIYKHG